MELQGKNQDGLSYSISLSENGYKLIEEDKTGASNSKFISADEIEEMYFYEGEGDKGELEIKLLNSDKVIIIYEIKDNNLVDKFLEDDDVLFDKPVSERKPDDPERDISCPNCDNILNKGSVFCSECGYDLKSNNKIKICPYCAEEISSRAVKCKHCGEWLDKKAKIRANSDSHTVALVLGYIFSIFGGLIGFIFAFYVLSLENKDIRAHGVIMIVINCIWIIILSALFVPTGVVGGLVLSIILIIIGYVFYSGK